MRERILEFLRAENKSSSQFADEIGVQPSGISHILSGRNNPSLDFVIKMLGRYKYLSAEWLLFGKGAMYRDNSGMPTLFDQDFIQPAGNQQGRPAEQANITPKNPDTNDSMASGADSRKEKTGEKTAKSGSLVEKIVWFYSDGSFEEYVPR